MSCMRGIFAAHAFAAFAPSVQILFQLESLPRFNEFQMTNHSCSGSQNSGASIQDKSE